MVPRSLNGAVWRTCEVLRGHVGQPVQPSTPRRMVWGSSCEYGAYPAAARTWCNWRRCIAIAMDPRFRPAPCARLAGTAPARWWHPAPGSRPARQRGRPTGQAPGPRGLYRCSSSGKLPGSEQAQAVAAVTPRSPLAARLRPGRVVRAVQPPGPGLGSCSAGLRPTPQLLADVSEWVRSLS